MTCSTPNACRASTNPTGSGTTSGPLVCSTGACD
jgi:hypothetical protein